MTSKIVRMEDGFIAEFDSVDENGWHEIIDRFDDANIYQTWTYDAVRQGERKLSHCVLKFNNEVVAATQLRVERLPLLGIGAAYVRWGPLWRLRDRQNDASVFRMAIRALRNEYVLKRGLFLRIFPMVFDNDTLGVSEILSSEGFVPSQGETPQRTLLLDLAPPLDEIRKNFDQKWRNCLNKAERNELQLTDGGSDVQFGQFIAIYRSLLDRKKFSEPNDINEFREIQRKLADKYKMGIFLTGKDGVPSCGGICTAIGSTGIYIFGACNDAGMKTNGSYMIQWKVIQWMKQNGCRYYNLNGINPQKNPGTYHFKAGAAGKAAIDVRYLGRFDSYSGSMKASLVNSGNNLNRSIKSIRAKLRKEK